MARPATQLPDGKYPIKNETTKTQRTLSRWATGWSKVRNAIPRTAIPKIRRIEESMLSQDGYGRMLCCFRKSSSSSAPKSGRTKSPMTSVGVQAWPEIRLSSANAAGSTRTSLHSYLYPCLFRYSSATRHQGQPAFTYKIIDFELIGPLSLWRRNTG